MMTNDEAYQWQLDRANKLEDQLANAEITLEEYRKSTKRSTDAMLQATMRIVELTEKVKKWKEIALIWENNSNKFEKNSKQWRKMYYKYRE